MSIRRIVDFCLAFWMKLNWLRPIQTNKVVFKSDRGQQYADSPYAIFCALRKLAPNLDLVWISQNNNNAPEGSRIVKAESLSEIAELATAKWWIDNKRKGNWCVKRNGQKYIQTWHGPIALKKIEKDAIDSLPASYIESAKRDSAMTDFFLSSCKWSTEFYRNSFWYDGPILEYGIPRSDIFYKDNESICSEVRKYYHLNNDDLMVLYAPTFRKADSLSAYKIDYDKLLEALEKRYSGKWCVVLRLHPNLIKLQSEIEYNDRIVNGNKIENINHIIIACDILITDYSSCMFDAMEAGKPVFLFANDVEEYKKDRDYYFSFDELPFSLAEDNEQLCKNLLEFNEDEYKQKVNQFMERLGYFNDGKSSERIAELIIRDIGENNG